MINYEFAHDEDEVYPTRAEGEARVCSFFADYAKNKDFSFWTDWHTFVVTDALRGKELCQRARKYLRAIAVPVFVDDNGEDVPERVGYHFYPGMIERRLRSGNFRGEWYMINKIARAGGFNYRLVPLED